MDELQLWISVRFLGEIGGFSVVAPGMNAAELAATGHSFVYSRLWRSAAEWFSLDERKQYSHYPFWNLHGLLSQPVLKRLPVRRQLDRHFWSLEGRHKVHDRVAEDCAERVGAELVGRPDAHIADQHQDHAAVAKLRIPQVVSQGDQQAGATCDIRLHP